MFCSLFMKRSAFSTAHVRNILLLFQTQMCYPAVTTLFKKTEPSLHIELTKAIALTHTTTAF